MHERSKPVSGENKKNISICCLLKISPRVLSVNNLLDLLVLRMVYPVILLCFLIHLTCALKRCK